MQLTINTIHNGSLDLHDAFKALAPRGLILEIVHPTSPTLFYRDGTYLYRSSHKADEPMSGAWDALQDPTSKFKVIKHNRHHYITTKALHD